jgi:cell division protein FtsZ
MDSNSARIKVVGVGGAGCNAVDHMVEKKIKNVEFIGLNTDKQALDKTQIPIQIQIGKKTTNGLGAGANPKIGRESAEEDKEAIAAALENADMVFVTAGMGGGTGTGAAPVVAQIAKDMDILTIAIVTKPFDFESRNKNANEGAIQLAKSVDSIIIVPNEKLLQALGEDVTMLKALEESNNVLKKSVQGIAELITSAGIINVDFADVKRIMKNSGYSMMGLGIASGQNRLEDAVDQAVNSALLENSSIHGAKRILVNVAGDINLPLNEYQKAGNMIKGFCDKDVEVISGMSINPELEDKIMITIVATDLQSQSEYKESVVIKADVIEEEMNINGLATSTSNQIEQSCQNNTSVTAPVVSKPVEDHKPVTDEEKKAPVKEKGLKWPIPPFIK